MNEKVMKHKSPCFLDGSKEPAVVAGEGMLRQNLGYDDTLMMVRVIFEKDAINFKYATKSKGGPLDFPPKSRFWPFVPNSRTTSKNNYNLFVSHFPENAPIDAAH